MLVLIALAVLKAWMDMQNFVDVLEEVQERLQKGFLGKRPTRSYTISDEDNAAADAWIRNWLRSGRKELQLTPLLCRSLLPRFALAAAFALDGAMRQRDWSDESTATDEVLLERLLIEYWPRLRERWEGGDVCLN